MKGSPPASRSPSGPSYRYVQMRSAELAAGRRRRRSRTPGPLLFVQTWRHHSTQRMARGTGAARLRLPRYVHDSLVSRRPADRADLRSTTHRRPERLSSKPCNGTEHSKLRCADRAPQSHPCSDAAPIGLAPTCREQVEFCRSPAAVARRASRALAPMRRKPMAAWSADEESAPEYRAGSARSSPQAKSAPR